MDALLATFEEELTARERANPLSTRRSQERTHHTASTLFSGSNTAPQCSYCQQSHSSAKCTTVTDIASRKHILKTSGHCFNCLRKNHVSRECKSSSRCLRCKKKHHTSICDANSRQPRHTSSDDTNSVQPQGSAGSALNPEAVPYQLSTTSSNLCSDNLRAVFLQTARAVIRNPNQSHSYLEVRLLLDSGSQKSYISERARELLNLDAIGDQTLSIATFGNHRGSKKVCPIVNVDLCLNGYSTMPLSLYVMPTICEPLIAQPIAACIRKHRHLSGLKLADFSHSESGLPVDVLIGSDYYWELVTGSVCRGDDGPTAIHTKLGWVLSGPSSYSESNRCTMNLSVTHVLHVDTGSEISSCDLDDHLRAFWELESLGIREEERTLYDDFTDTVRFEDGRYNGKSFSPGENFTTRCQITTS